MLPLFQDRFIFGEATSSHFFRVIISIQQLIFRSSYFFRETAFLGSPFPEESLICSIFLFFQSIYFFRVKLLASSHFLRIVQLLFETATFLAEDLLGIKISTKLIYRCCCTASTFSEEQHFGKN